MLAEWSLHCWWYRRWRWFWDQHWRFAWRWLLILVWLNLFLNIWIFHFCKCLLSELLNFVLYFVECTFLWRSTHHLSFIFYFYVFAFHCWLLSKHWRNRSVDNWLWFLLVWSSRSVLFCTLFGWGFNILTCCFFHGNMYGFIYLLPHFINVFLIFRMVVKTIIKIECCECILLIDIFTIFFIVVPVHDVINLATN